MYDCNPIISLLPVVTVALHLLTANRLMMNWITVLCVAVFLSCQCSVGHGQIVSANRTTLSLHSVSSSKTSLQNFSKYQYEVLILVAKTALFKRNQSYAKCSKVEASNQLWIIVIFLHTRNILTVMCNLGHSAY